MIVFGGAGKPRPSPQDDDGRDEAGCVGVKQLVSSCLLLNAGARFSVYDTGMLKPNECT